MAKPQVEDGFVMIALDLFAAILAADLPNRDMIILAEVLLWSYGPAKRRDLSLDPHAIAHYTGQDPRNVRAAIKALVRARLLVANPEGSYRFNKDYETWDLGERSLARRLEGGLLRFVRAAVSRFGRPIKRSKRVAVQPNPIQTSVRVQPNPIQTSVRVQPNPPLIGTRASEDQTDKREKTDTPPSAAADAAAAGGLISPIPGHEEAIAAARLLNDAFAATVEAMGRDIDRALSGRFDCYVAAIHKAKRSRSEIADLHGFCLAVARSYLADGLRPDPVSAAPDRVARPSPAAARRKALREAILRMDLSSPKGIGDAC